MKYPREIKIREVGPRDGLQSITKIIPTEAKIQLINCLIESGLKEIEVTSFVSPKSVPQMKDAEEVVNSIRRRKGVNLSALVANIIGTERALKTKLDELHYVISVSETHNRHNTNQSIRQSLEQLNEIVNLARNQDVRVGVALATAFGCPYEGKIHYQQIEKLVSEIGKLGITEFTLADTASMVELRNLEETIKALKRDFKDFNFALHLHAPEGLGMDTVLTAIENGINTFETSVGGLGGCPFIPNAVGNISTEAVVTTMHLLGIETGIDLHRLKKCSNLISTIAGEDIKPDINLKGF